MLSRSRSWILAAIVVLGGWGGTQGADWPSFRGPNRDGICTETGLLRQWPEEGPPLLWRSEDMGEGFAGVSVKGSLLYTMGQRNGREWVICVDSVNGGRVIWAFPMGPVRHKGGGYPGPRCTPSLYRDHVYALSMSGDLVCLDAMKGQYIWHRNLPMQFRGETPKWGYSESPLVDGRWVVCTPGGSMATIVALWRLNGEKVWASPIGDPAGYSSLIKVSIGGTQQYVQFAGGGVVSVRVRGGGLLWRWNKPANETANVNTPVWFGQTIFAAGGEGSGSGVVFPIKHGEEFIPKEIYFNKDLQVDHGGAILWNGYLYASVNPNKLTCLDYKTGEVIWEDESCGKCSLLFADGMLYARDENGPVSLVRATPEKFELRGRFSPRRRSRKQSWVHPVISGGRLFLREQNTLFCYDVAIRPEEAQSKEEEKDSRRRSSRSR
jgi:outer membrane protein assembly factor BamB